MKKIKHIACLALIAAFIPFTALAVPVSVDRISDRIEPLIKTDFMRGAYFYASSTSATSSFLGNVYVSGAFRDSSNAAGTLGMVLQTTGTGTRWVATSTLGISAGSGSGTVTSVAATVPTGLTISGSPITTSGTLAFGLGAGYVIPLTASTTEWAAASASTTAMTPAYIRALLSGTSPITFNSGTGAIGFSFSTDNTWTGLNSFGNASSSSHTVTGNLYSGSLANGCVQVSGGLLASTGTACGSGGGSSTTTLLVGSGFLYTATSTDSVRAAYFVATSTTATSTFAGNVDIRGDLLVDGDIVLDGVGEVVAVAVAAAIAAIASAVMTMTNKRMTKRVTTAADATSITPNTDNADITYQANTQAAGTLTINADSGTPTNGQPWLLKIKSTNAQTFSWNADYVGGTNALPTATSGGSNIDYFAFIYDTVDSVWHYTGGATNF